MTPARWTMLVVVLLLVGGVALFTVQNVERTTDLSFDLWVWATHLRRPLPVPYLLLGAFGAGLLLGGGWGILGRVRAAGRIGELEQDLARATLRTGAAPSASSRTGEDDPWA